MTNVVKAPFHESRRENSKARKAIEHGFQRHLSSMLTLLGWVTMLLLGGSCAALSGGNYRSEPEQVSLQHRRFFYTLFVPAESDLMKVRAALSPPETFHPHSRASPAIINR
jgi:hypothetical protein